MTLRRQIRATKTLLELSRVLDQQAPPTTVAEAGIRIVKQQIRAMEESGSALPDKFDLFDVAVRLLADRLDGIEDDAYEEAVFLDLEKIKWDNNVQDSLRWACVSLRYFIHEKFYTKLREAHLHSEIYNFLMNGSYAFNFLGAQHWKADEGGHQMMNTMKQYCVEGLYGR